MCQNVLMRFPNKPASDPKSLGQSCPLTLHPCMGALGLGLWLNLGDRPCWRWPTTEPVMGHGHTMVPAVRLQRQFLFCFFFLKKQLFQVGLLKKLFQVHVTCGMDETKQEFVAKNKKKDCLKVSKFRLYYIQSYGLFNSAMTHHGAGRVLKKENEKLRVTKKNIIK